MTVLGLPRRSERVPANGLGRRLEVVLSQVPERGLVRLLLVDMRR